MSVVLGTAGYRVVERAIDLSGLESGPNSDDHHQNEPDTRHTRTFDLALLVSNDFRRVRPLFLDVENLVELRLDLTETSDNVSEDEADSGAEGEKYDAIKQVLHRLPPSSARVWRGSYSVSRRKSVWHQRL